MQKSPGAIAHDFDCAAIGKKGSFHWHRCFPECNENLRQARMGLKGMFVLAADGPETMEPPADLSTDVPVLWIARAKLQTRLARA